MTPQKQGKHVQRAIRNIPVEEIAPRLDIEERNGNGMYCLVAGELQFVAASGGHSITQWDDPVEYALLVRYVQAHPERIHVSHEEAVAFVRAQLGAQNQTGGTTG